MKKVILVLALIALIATPAFAYYEGDVCDTTMGKTLFNKCVNQSQADKVSTPLGVGLDLVLLESGINDITYKITGEYKYDWNNAEHSAYAVLTLKLADILAKFKK